MSASTTETSVARKIWNATATGLMFGFLCVAFPALAATDPALPSATPTTADHSKFKELEGPFATGPDVTKACLQCHTEASKQIQHTTHWTWAFDNPVTGQELGKRNIVNNFCVATSTNWPRCTSCHVGYGWSQEETPPKPEAAVDCLVCHDTTGDYKKFPAGSGHPVYEPIEFPPGSGKVWTPPDLGKVARNVGEPTRQNCGACHFFGGGGNGVKHGDLDSSMFKPDKALDVHMDVNGLNFSCQTCHTTGSHEVTGSRYVTKAVDRVGIDIPGKTDNTRATCESCHGQTPHESAKAPIRDAAKIDDHTDTVACPTCHVPEFARGGRKTKMWWDWSTAGKMNEAGKPFEMTEAGYPVYDSKKGDFVWEDNVKPEYYWFDGEVRYTLFGEAIDPSGVVQINKITGHHGDADSRIWPFKVMRGKQPYDTQSNILAVPHLFGKDDAAYWKTYDWTKAIEAGLQAKGVAFSGSYDFAQTEYYWPITHMVAPKDKALVCADCHQENGRLATLAGFYMPGRDSFDWLTTLGIAASALTLLGVIGHGLIRLFSSSRKKG